MGHRTGWGCPHDFIAENINKIEGGANLGAISLFYETGGTPALVINNFTQIIYICIFLLSFLKIDKGLYIEIYFFFSIP